MAKVYKLDSKLVKNTDKLLKEYKERKQKLALEGLLAKKKGKKLRKGAVPAVEFKRARNNRERLELSLKMLLRLIPLAEKAYRSKQSQGNCYALTNLLTQAREIMHALEAIKDYDKMSEDLYEDVLTPFMEELIRAYGRAVKKHRDSLDSALSNVKERRKASTLMHDMYREFGVICEKHLNELKSGLNEYINNYS